MTRFLLVLSLLSLVACQQHEVTPNPAPPFQVPKAFDGAKEGVERVDRWWENFKDPGLNDTISAALEGNLNLRQAWARIEQARALISQANAAALP